MKVTGIRQAQWVVCAAVLLLMVGGCDTGGAAVRLARPTASVPAPSPVVQPSGVSTTPSAAATPRTSPPPTAFPIDEASRVRFLGSWAKYGVACWGTLVAKDLVAALPEKAGSCDPFRTADDDAGTLGYFLVHNLLAIGPAPVEQTFGDRVGTCRGIWLRTALSVETLNDSIRRAYLLPKSMWRTKDEAEIVSGALSFLAGTPTMDDCDRYDMSVPSRDLISLRVDLAADAKQFDRMLGGWFGRRPARSSDVLDAGIEMSTWAGWRPRLIIQEAGDGACARAFTTAYQAADQLAGAAESVWGYLKHLKGFGTGFLDDPSGVNQALERDLPEALARFESCS